jgi:hypothetical protein
MRAALVRRRPAAARPVRRPVPGERTGFRDPRGPGGHSTLPYREATELLRCIEIMGPGSESACREQVLELGTRFPRPPATAPPAAAPPAPAAPPPLATGMVANISSPVPVGATALKGGGRRATIGGIRVTIARDARSADPALAGRAVTRISHSWTGLSYTTDAQGSIESFTPATITATIQTTYGAGTTASSPAGYGRGTTAADIAAGETSLGFHEGSHGRDYINTLNATPAPAFGGAVGQPEADFLAARDAFGAAVTSYFAAAERASEIATDCVGVTIDQANLQQGTITNVCPAPPAAGGGTP